MRLFPSPVQPSPVHPSPVQPHLCTRIAVLAWVSTALCLALLPHPADAQSRLTCVPAPAPLRGVTCSDGQFYEGPKAVDGDTGLGGGGITGSGGSVSARTARLFERSLGDLEFEAQKRCGERRLDVAEQALCTRRELDAAVAATGDAELIRYYRQVWRNR